MRAPRTALALVVSAVVHVGAGALLARVEAPPPPARPSTPTVITVVSEAPAPTPEPDPIAAPEPPRPPRDAVSDGAPSAPDPSEVARAEAARREAERAAAEAARLDAARAETARLDAARVTGGGDPSAPRGLDLALRADPTARPSSGGSGGARATADASASGGEGDLPPGLQPSGGGTYRFEDRGFVAEIDHDGTVHFRDRAPVGVSSPISLAFDVTEAVMMLRGDDPYRPEKVRFLEQTQALRAKLCGAAHTERLRRALVSLPGELEKVWNDESRSLADRRRLLFERWDECADHREETEIARMGAMARATVLAFIRRALPAGSPHAYTEAELVAFNARRVSRESFSPY